MKCQFFLVESSRVALCDVTSRSTSCHILSCQIVSYFVTLHYAAACHVSPLISVDISDLLGQSVISSHRWGYICIGASESSWSKPAQWRHLSAGRLLFNCFIIVYANPSLISTLSFSTLICPGPSPAFSSHCLQHYGTYLLSKATITINAAVGGTCSIQTCFSRLNKRLLINRLRSQGAELHSTICLSNYTLITTVYANTLNICIEHSHNFLLSFQERFRRREQQLE